MSETIPHRQIDMFDVGRAPIRFQAAMFFGVS
jgi:hypothetical protein